MAAPGKAAKPQAPWKSLGSPLGEDAWVKMIVAAGPIVYVQTQAGLYGSVDGGKKWRLVDAQFRGLKDKKAAQSIAIRGKSVVYVKEPGNVVRSQDGGKTWTPVVVNTESTSGIGRGGVATLGNAFLLADQKVGPAGTFAVLRSEDDGKTWAPYLSAPGKIDELFTLGDKLFVSVMTYSDDTGFGPPMVLHQYEGKKWNRVYRDVAGSPSMVSAEQISKISGDTMIIDAGEAKELSISDGLMLGTGAPSWRPLAKELGGALAGDSIDGLYLLGDGKLMRSLDDGASWAQVAPLPFEKGCSRPTVLDRQLLVLCEFADAPKYGLFAIDTSKLSKPKKP